MTIKRNKLSVKKESLRTLSDRSLAFANGGWVRTNDCAYGSVVQGAWVPANLLPRGVEPVLRDFGVEGIYIIR